MRQSRSKSVRKTKKASPIRQLAKVHTTYLPRSTIPELQKSFNAPILEAITHSKPETSTFMLTNPNACLNSNAPVITFQVIQPSGFPIFCYNFIRKKNHIILKYLGGLL